MLWAVFTIVFYGFFRGSKLLQTLEWFDIALLGELKYPSINISLRQICCDEV